MAAVASAVEREDYSGYEPEDEKEGGQDEAANSRAFNMAQNLARKKAAAGVEDIKQEAFRQAAELVKQRARQLVLRRVSLAFAATLVGLIVAYLIMTAQMILGNWLKVSGVPPLELWEQIVWGVASLIILFVMLIILGLITFILHLMSNIFTFIGAIIGNVFGGDWNF